MTDPALPNGAEVMFRIGDHHRIGWQFETPYFAVCTDIELRDTGGDLGEWFVRMSLGPIDLGWMPEERAQTL